MPLRSETTGLTVGNRLRIRERPSQLISWSQSKDQVVDMREYSRERHLVNLTIV